MFRRAQRSESPLKIALVGPSGSGKTYTALALATGIQRVLVRRGQASAGIALIDTERGTSAKYAGLFEFDICTLESFSPRDYITAIEAAIATGYGVLVIDSLSHAWIGPGGILEMVEAARQRSSSPFAGWRDASPMHWKLVDMILRAPIDIIATMRAKHEYVVEEVGGKAVPRRVGLAPVQRDGIEYEFDIVGVLDESHRLTVTKSRIAPFADVSVLMPGPELGERFAEWRFEKEVPVETPVNHVPAPAQVPLPEEKPTEEEVNALKRLAARRGHTRETFYKLVADLFGHEDVSRLTRSELEKLRGAIEQ